jgi:hypothetical protein
MAKCVVPWSFVLLQNCNFWYFIECIFLSTFFKKKPFKISCDYKFCLQLQDTLDTIIILFSHLLIWSFHHNIRQYCPKIS